MRHLVNKQQLAELLGVSAVTLNVWMRRYRDGFPVVYAGRQGRHWRFEPAAVVAFLARARSEEAERLRQRHDVKAQTLAQLPRPDLDAGRAAREPSARDHLLALKLRRIRREETAACAALMRTDEAEAGFRVAVGVIDRSIREFCRQIGRELAWSDEFARQVEARAMDMHGPAIAAVEALFAAARQRAASTPPARAEAAELPLLAPLRLSLVA